MTCAARLRSNLRWWGPIAVLLLTAGLVTAATDREVLETGGVRFDHSIEQPGGELHLVGAGVLRWKVLFRAYASAFYLPQGIPPDQWDRDVPKRLVIHYFWDIAGDEFGPAGEAVLRRMYSEEQLDPVREQLDALRFAYKDILKGDRYALAYAPGQGTTLLHNDQPVITLPGADFARLYFSVWLGPDPVDRGLRDKLLGGS